MLLPIQRDTFQIKDFAKVGVIMTVFSCIVVAVVMLRRWFDDRIVLGGKKGKGIISYGMVLFLVA